MKFVKLFIWALISLLIFSCENDRDRIQAHEIQIDGAWTLTSMVYTDSKGSIITVPGDRLQNELFTTITFDRSEGRGTLRVDSIASSFRYIYGNGMCELTFDEIGKLNIKSLNVPRESIGKVYPYKFTFITPDQKFIRFVGELEMISSSGEVITDVQYTFARN